MENISISNIDIFPSKFLTAKPGSEQGHEQGHYEELNPKVKNQSTQSPNVGYLALKRVDTPNSSIYGEIPIDSNQVSTEATVHK